MTLRMFKLKDSCPHNELRLGEFSTEFHRDNPMFVYDKNFLEAFDSGKLEFIEEVNPLDKVIEKKKSGGKE